jgi:hypothetical protein
MAVLTVLYAVVLTRLVPVPFLAALKKKRSELSA